MSRYIDADKIKDELLARDAEIGKPKDLKMLIKSAGIFEALIHIQLAPAEEVAPVVHAYNKSKDGFLCSACTFGDFGLFNHGGKYTPKYCPNCGARMDGENNVD